MSFLIRDAEPADLEDLRAIFRRASLSNEEDRESLLANPEALELSDVPATKGRRRVATLEDGRVAGFATALFEGRAIELDDLFVDPGYMRRGIGRALVRDVVDLAATQGIRSIKVTANNHALGFYQKMGFVQYYEVQTRFGRAARLRLEVDS